MATTIQNPPPTNPHPAPEGESFNGKQMSFLEHLEELRKRLLYSVYSIAAGFLISLYWADNVYAYLARPMTDTLHALGMSEKLAYTNPVDPFNLYIKLRACSVSVIGRARYATRCTLWACQRSLPTPTLSIPSTCTSSSLTCPER